MSDTLELARDLVRRRSVTPDDAGCQGIIAEHLADAGFARESLDCGGVVNSWIRRGDSEPLFVFAGHTDVVPPGDEQAWRHPPFDALVRDGMLHGRGAADMKGGLASMVTAGRRFVVAHPRHGGSIALLLTSNEEGVAEDDGTRHAVDVLQSRGEAIRWCIVAEPSSETRAGDTIRTGRRGSLSARLEVIGRQGHVAYAERARNPIHLAAPLLAGLCAKKWDRGNRDFPPSSLQVSGIQAGTGAENVIPGRLEIKFNIRYSTEIDEQKIKDAVTAMIEAEELEYEIEWRLSGRPFLTDGNSELASAVRTALRETAGCEPVLSTGGGTSDARFIAPTGAEVIELGPVNSTIHAVDEQVSTADLDMLSDAYLRVLENLLPCGP